MARPNQTITSCDILPVSEITGRAAPVELFAVVAETARGEVFLHQRQLGRANAEHLATKVRAAGRIQVEHWDFWRTIYGSAAFLAEEQEAVQFAQLIRQGAARETDVPEHIRVYL